MQIDHICIAARSIDRAMARFTDIFGYHQKTEKVTNTRQQVNVVFLAKDGSMDIKIIEPSCKESPLISSLKKGEGLHHICFKSEATVDDELCKLKEKGVRVLTEPEIGEAFNNEKIAFVYAGFGLNIELIDTDKRAGILK